MQWQLNRQFPPIIEDLDRLVLSRKRFGSSVTVWMANGDTYNLSVDQIKKYLELLGCPDCEKPIDYLWNFGAIVLNVRSGMFRWLPRENIAQEAILV